jgi:hypothetical protein
VDYTYDDAGNVITFGYPGGTTIATSFNANNPGDIIRKDGSQIVDYDYVGRRLGSLTEPKESSCMTTGMMISSRRIRERTTFWRAYTHRPSCSEL